MEDLLLSKSSALKLELVAEATEAVAPIDGNTVPQQTIQLNPAQDKLYKEHQCKEQGKRVFCQENGIAVVCDLRVKSGYTLELQIGVWICHPDSREMMEERIRSVGLRVREMTAKEDEILSKKASVKIDMDLKLANHQKRNQRRS